MGQHYSDPKRERDPHALPDIETFEVDANDPMYGCQEDAPLEPGWYYWVCFPGCLPDSEPMGPFATEDDALADARAGMDDDDETDGGAA